MNVAAQSSSVLICGHVFRSERPVRLMVRDKLGSLQLLCGELKHDFDKDLHHVHLQHLLSRQQDLADTLNRLKAGEYAEFHDGCWNVGTLGN